MRSHARAHTGESVAVAADLVGQVRRFGPHGILYEVVEHASGDMVKIRVLDTGEELDYPVSKALSDPRR